MFLKYIVVKRLVIKNLGRGTSKKHLGSFNAKNLIEIFVFAIPSRLSKKLCRFITGHGRTEVLSNPPTFWLVHSIFCSNSLEQSKNSQLIYFFRFNKLFWQIVKKKFYLNTRAKSERKWVTTILVHLCSWSSIQGLSTQIIFVNIFSCLMNEWMNEVQYWVQLPIKSPKLMYVCYVYQLETPIPLEVWKASHSLWEVIQCNSCPSARCNVKVTNNNTTCKVS